MHTIKRFLICFVILSFSSHSWAGENNCQNLGFELGNFVNWTGQTWLYSTDEPSINTSKATGFKSRRQTIISDTTAYDANTGYALKKIPSGYKYSARLGDATTSTDSNPRCWEQSVQYKLTVDSTNALLIMKFACVLEYASDHTALMEPRFKLTLYDSTGTKINDCANYDVYASNTSAKGFNTYTPSSSSSSSPDGKVNPVKWRDWTTVGANLLSYMGQTITIEFMSADCTGRFHYGYAYFVASCQPMAINLKYCAGDASAVLTAPEGFESYKWVNSSGTSVATSRILSLSTPTEGDVYTCQMTSATGCTTTLKATVMKYIPKAKFGSYMIDCNSNTVQMTDSSTTTHGTLTHLWDFGDGTTSTEQKPQHTFSTSGLHDVKLKITNLPMMCVDSITQTVESFSPPLVGIIGDSIFCPGDSVKLKAYGAAIYKWSTGETTDSITVNSSNKYWLVGRSTTGCHSDTIYKTVLQDPDWTFSCTGDTTFCKGESSVLTATGAVKYLWSTGDTTSSITVTKTGVYTVTGYNANGCDKSHAFYVTVYDLPEAQFTLSQDYVNVKHSEVIGTTTTQTAVSYLWDLGDGTTTGSLSFTHNYNTTNGTLVYPVSLTATNTYGCKKTSLKNINVIPFIPNVFSPNGDGVNDSFMPNIDLKIYDRNGLLLYAGDNGWDGKYNGKAVDPDTYFYVVTYHDSDNNEQVKKGYITLVR